jgi:Carboxypeptidase regulatory-like domain
MRQTRRWILSLLLIISGSGACYAQSINAGDIRGSVTDPTGALVPGVTVTVMDTDTGISKDFTTNNDGLFDTNSIVPGQYTITFTKDGFEQLVRGPITLEVGFTTVNGQLKVGSTSQQVTVNTDVPLLTTETGDQTMVLSDKVMGELPQVGTDWENFMTLLPGATPSLGGNGVSGLSINGNLPYSNVLQNGVTTTLPSSQNATVANFENVAEIQVSMSSFSAQYGIGGMVFNQVTKSGNSKFHGSAYDYIQNDALNANSFGFLSQPTVPYLRQNHFGGAVGGPVLKKKMFFYFDFDQIVDHGSSSNSTNTIPTQATMGGNFSGQWPIYDPTTQTIAYDSLGNPYPVRQTFQSEYGSNAIPAAMIDTVAAKIQQLYPAPGGSTCQNNSPTIQVNCIVAGGKFIPGSIGSEGETSSNFYSTLPASYPTRRYFGRLDYDITPNNRLSMSDSQDDSPAIYPSSVTPDPIGWTGADVDDKQAQITDVWNISPHVINEARIGYTFEDSIWGDLSLNKGYAAQLGWQFGVADDLPSTEFYNQYPYAWLTPATNSNIKQNVFDPSDVVTIIKGRHILHFGGEFLIYRDDSTAWGNVNAGTMEYTGQYTQGWTTDNSVCQSSTPGVACPIAATGLEYADFLLGQVQSWSASYQPEFGARLKSPQSFIQDDFKLRPNLTLNLGLRYQINHGWNEVHGNEASFDPTVQNPATNTLGAYWYGTTHANGRTAIQANVFNDVMPRVGFSWSPNPKTTVRGGFGLFSYNWSLGNYASGGPIAGGAFLSSGNDTDETNGITPVTQLDGTGTIYGTTTKLPYTVNSNGYDPTAYNGEGVSYQAYHTPIPKIYQWNFALQRELMPNLVVELGYVASHGFALIFPTDLNAVPQQYLSSNDSQYRPYPVYQSISGSTNNAVSNYNSMQASVTKRMSSGVSLSFNYVLSHMLDTQDSSGWGSHAGPQNWQIANNPAANYSNSNFDIRSAFKGYAIYQLPFGKGRRFLNNNMLTDEVIGGWQLSGTLYWSTGTPYSVFGTQNTYQLAGSSFPNWVPGVNPKPTNRSAKCEAGSGPQNGCLNEWFNPAAFSQPANGTFGNVRRNILYGPGTNTVDLSMFKEFSLPWEGIRLKLSCAATNAFNHPAFANPSGTLQGAAGVGQPYSWYTTSSSGQQVGTQQITGVNVYGRSGEVQLRVEF